MSEQAEFLTKWMARAVLAGLGMGLLYLAATTHVTLAHPILGSQRPSLLGFLVFLVGVLAVVVLVILALVALWEAAEWD